MIYHSFKDAPGAPDLFNGTTTLEEFIKKLNKLAEDLSTSDDKDIAMLYGRKRHFTEDGDVIYSEEDKNKILGDGFELFVEILIKLLGAHPHIGIGNYKPFGQEDGEEDQGIDGFGINMKGQRTAVQCKFTNNATYEFTANDSNLPNFLVEAALEGLLKKGQVYLFTTAKGINWYTAAKWRHTVIELTRDDISILVKKNGVFWTDAYNLF